MQEALSSLAQLGPALGSVVVIGVICYQLLKMFDKHSQALQTIQKNMEGHTTAMEVMSKNVEFMSENVKENTEVTKKMSDVLQNVELKALRR